MQKKRHAFSDTLSAFFKSANVTKRLQSQYISSHCQLDQYDGPFLFWWQLSPAKLELKLPKVHPSFHFLLFIFVAVAHPDYTLTMIVSRSRERAPLFPFRFCLFSEWCSAITFNHTVNAGLSEQSCVTVWWKSHSAEASLAVSKYLWHFISCVYCDKKLSSEIGNNFRTDLWVSTDHVSTDNLCNLHNTADTHGGFQNLKNLKFWIWCICSIRVGGSEM